MSESNPTLAIVLIGRNEGKRLIRCLASVIGKSDWIVYVDSGSTDGSVAAAKAAGVNLVELDRSRAFCAARARNAGFQWLSDLPAHPDIVQFLDGDCILKEGWIDAARDAILADARLAIAAGWLIEQHPERSIYNAMCALEWKKPAGPIISCGGIMMVRYAAFESVGGFNETVIAAEDDEFCLRIALKNWKLVCLPVEMAYHDTAMTHFRQWWRRAVRAGHGFAQVGTLHKGYFLKSRLRAVLWAGVLPVLAVVAGLFSPWLLLVVGAAYLASYLRNVKRLRREGLAQRAAMHQAVFFVLGKFPNLLGILTYYWRRIRDSEIHIIEHK